MMQLVSVGRLERTLEICFATFTSPTSGSSLQLCKEAFLLNACRKAYYIQGVPGGRIIILGGHSVDHSKQKKVYCQVYGGYA
jgi:hypothetical protein